MFPLALFDVLATAESPGHGGVGLAHFFTGVAATRFRCLGGSGGAVTVAAIVWIEVGSSFISVANNGRSVTALEKEEVEVLKDEAAYS